MQLYAKTIYEYTKENFEKKKKELIEEFEKFGIEYGIIESDHNSEGGYVAEIHWIL